jgi:hypothetical protein
MTPAAGSKPATNATWINTFIVAGSVMFIVALAVSALFAPQWRILHLLQGSIYIVMIILTRRQSAWGFGAGALVATFWNGLVLLRSPVGPEGLHAIESLLRGGSAPPDILLQLFGACGHFLIIAACLVGFLRLRPAAREWGQFVGGGVLAIAFLLVMAFTVGPPEAAVHIKHAFGL